MSVAPAQANGGDDVRPACMPSAAPPLLGFMAGAGHWLVEAGSGVQVIDAAITPVPLTRPWYLGLVRYRQRLLGAIDLSGLHGAEVAPVKPTERLLVLPPPWHSALRVDRVQGLMDAASLENADANGVRWQRLDIHRLCISADFLNAGLGAMK